MIIIVDMKAFECLNVSIICFFSFCFIAICISCLVLFHTIFVVAMLHYPLYKHHAMSTEYNATSTRDNVKPKLWLSD
jgi:uncharacterized membrane protein